MSEPAELSMSSPTHSRVGTPSGAAFRRNLHSNPSAHHVALPATMGTVEPNDYTDPIQAPHGPANIPQRMQSRLRNGQGKLLMPIPIPALPRPALSAPVSPKANTSPEPATHSTPTTVPSSPRPLGSVARVIRTANRRRPETAPQPQSPPTPTSAPEANDREFRAFQSLVDHQAASIPQNMSRQSGERAGSLGSTAQPTTLELSDVNEERRPTGWESFAVAYAAGRFNPMSIPSQPTGRQPSLTIPPALPPVQEAQSSRMADTSVTSLPSSGLSSTCSPPMEHLPQSTSPKSPLPEVSSFAAAISKRQKSLDLESLPNLTKAPATRLSPSHETSSSNGNQSLAAATVRLASSSTPDSMFAPFGRPSPTRELLDPLANLISGQGSSLAEECCRKSPDRDADQSSGKSDYPDDWSVINDERAMTPGRPLVYPSVVHPKDLGPFYERYGFLPGLFPPNEAERAKALYSYSIWESPADPNFDRIVHMAKLVFNARMVWLTFVDGSHEWVKSQSVYAITKRPRGETFSSHAILLNSDEPLVILDARKDWRFQNNPRVKFEPHIRFYAGAPLRTPDGYNLGTLSIVDDKPWLEFSPRSRHILKELAAVAMRELELWRDKLQLRTRDKIQKSMEVFTRECLEIDETLVTTDFESASKMDQVYNRAARLVHSTLELDGCSILDISQFERVEMGAPDGDREFVYRANPFNDSEAVFERIDSFGPVSAFPVLASTSPTMTTRQLTSMEHQRMSEFLRDDRDGKIFDGIVPSWIRDVVPAAVKYCLAMPIFGIDHQPFALICAYTLDKSQQFLEGYELQYLRAIGVIILSAVLRRRMVLADKSKSVLISSVSHELRTPLHGILAAAELLKDTPLDHSQTSYLQTVTTCGMQLIETVNHVLDFTKLVGTAKNNTGSQHIKPTSVNLADLVEQTVESTWLGLRARAMQVAETDVGSFYAPPASSLIPPHMRGPVAENLAHVETIIDISLRTCGWNVLCEAGGLRRIVMNLYSNSLKFTKNGYVQVILRELPHHSDPTRLMVELIVVDTGKGMGKEFLKGHLFHPFAQENPQQAGTGLGLAIVNSIVRSDSVKGTLDVWSAEGVGTEVRVQFEVEVDQAASRLSPPQRLHFAPGLKIAFLAFDPLHPGQALSQEVLTQYSSSCGFEVVQGVSEANVVIVNELPLDSQKLDNSQGVTDQQIIVLTSRRVSEVDRQKHSSCWILSKPIRPGVFLATLQEVVFGHEWTGVLEEERLSVSAAGLTVNDGRNGIEELALNSRVLPPGTTLEIQNHHLRRRRSDETPPRTLFERPSLGPRGQTCHGVCPGARRDVGSDSLIKSLGPSTPSPTSTISTISLADGGAMLREATVTRESERSGSGVSGVVPRKAARVLVVEDNPINRKVLAAYLKKKGHAYVETHNGAAGVDMFERTAPNSWDVILMDITMPIMDGYEATKRIRRIESRRLTEADSQSKLPSDPPLGRVKIFALTGLAAPGDKRAAFSSGVDGYLVKPVSLASLDQVFKKIGF